MMALKYLCLALLLTGWTVLGQTNTLFLASFNIQSLGPTKMGRPEFVNTVVRILAKYDIILIQEIKGSIQLWKWI